MSTARSPLCGADFIRENQVIMGKSRNLSATRVRDAMLARKAKGFEPRRGGSPTRAAGNAQSSPIMGVRKEDKGDGYAGENRSGAV